MEGMHRAIYIGDFERIIERNAYAPWELNFYSSRWGRYQGAPANTCTLVKGNMNYGEARNIPIPDIPEHTVQDSEGHIIHRGWRTLLKFMCQDRWIRPSDEIRKLLGEDDFAKARKGLKCW